MRPLFPLVGTCARGWRPELGNYPTNGGDILKPMPDTSIRAILAANLAALMRYAGDHQRESEELGALSSQVGLESVSGVSNSTISRYLRQEVAAKIDDIHRLAVAYGLHGWQLLFPSLDPANPPVVPYTATERELYKVLKAGVEVIARRGELDVSQESESGAVRDGRGHRKVSSKVKKRHKA